MSFFGEHAFTAIKSSETEMQDSSGSAADSDKKLIPEGRARDARLRRPAARLAH